MEHKENRLISGEKVTENIRLCPDGKYRWIYEFSMLKNPAVLRTVFKVLGISAGAVVLFVLLIGLFEGGIAAPAAGEGKVLLLVLVFFAVLVLVSYLIVAGMYGWTYVVLFEMDEETIVHMQMPKQFQKAEALGWLAAMAGLAAGSPGLSGAGVLAASRSTLVTRFSEVRTVTGERHLHLIRLDRPLDHNQVYADEGDYDFVWDYITGRCVNARIR